MCLISLTITCFLSKTPIFPSNLDSGCLRYSKIGVSSSFETDVPLEWAVIGLLFCTVVGVIYGMLPAIKASRLNPIDALRYE